VEGGTGAGPTVGPDRQRHDRRTQHDDNEEDPVQLTAARLTALLVALSGLTSASACLLAVRALGA